MQCHANLLLCNSQSTGGCEPDAKQCGQLLNYTLSPNTASLVLQSDILRHVQHEAASQELRELQASPDGWLTDAVCTADERP